MKLAAVFPGQGSQSVGMLADLHSGFDVVRETFAEASEVLGYDIWALLRDGPEETLKKTEYTQPVMYVSGIAVWRSWQALNGPQVSLLAGHSLGEYAALTASGVFDFKACVGLVAERGRLMAGAVPDGVGGMAAVLGLDDEAITELCRSVSGERVVEAVNFNAPGQVVISGHLDAVEKAVTLAKEQGARRAVILPVSVPNHSSLMNDVAAPLADKITEMHAGQPQVPVVQNLEARSYDTTDAMLEALKKHVCSPVYWTDSVREMKNQGAELVIEMGPGKVLTGLNKRIDKTLPGICIEDMASLEKAIELANTAN